MIGAQFVSTTSEMEDKWITIFHKVYHDKLDVLNSKCVKITVDYGFNVSIIFIFAIK